MLDEVINSIDSKSIKDKTILIIDHNIDKSLLSEKDNIVELV